MRLSKTNLSPPLEWNEGTRSLKDALPVLHDMEKELLVEKHAAPQGHLYPKEGPTNRSVP